MIINDLKADLSEAAQAKLKETIETAVEKKLEKKMKKVVGKLTRRFLITGIAMAGALLLVNNAGAIAKSLTKSKK